MASILATTNPLEFPDVSFDLSTSIHSAGTKTLTLTLTCKFDSYKRHTVGVEGYRQERYVESSYLRGCYDFDYCGISEYDVKIDSDNVLNPRDLSVEDKTLLKILNPQIPDFVWTIYYLMKDCLDSKISEEELLDRLYLMVDNKPNF